MLSLIFFASSALLKTYALALVGYLKRGGQRIARRYPEDGKSMTRDEEWRKALMLLQRRGERDYTTVVITEQFAKHGRDT
jgi:hypothetical protein